MIHCNPDKHALAGNNCVFVGPRGSEGAAGIPAVLGRLVRATAEEWVVRQYGAGSKDMKLPRSTWPHAWVVFRRDQAV